MTSPRLNDLPPPPPGRSGWPWDHPHPPVPSTSSGPRITLVTPSYNQGPFIEETIRSVLLQGYSDLEYIVIDGGSTDGTVDILKKYSPWISHWVSERDRGQSDAINKGLARATGDWFNWINSDDYLLPGALGALIGSAQTDTAAIVAGTTVNVRDGAVFGRYHARIEDSPRTLFFLGVNQPGSLLRLDQVRAAGGVREDLGLCMDLDLWQRILAGQGPDGFHAIADEVAAYRYHQDSKTCRETDAFALEEYALLFDLAVSLGANLPGSFATLRAAARFSAKPPLLPIGAASAADAETVFLERLLVRDSLLFRALCKQDPAADTLHARFLGLLDDIAPVWTRRFSPEPFHQRRAQALVAAAQSLPRFAPAFFWSAFCSRPSPRILIEALRVLKRS
jgi:hypothetical protein